MSMNSAACTYVAESGFCCTYQAVAAVAYPTVFVDLTTIQPCPTSHAGSVAATSTVSFERLLATLAEG